MKLNTKTAFIGLPMLRTRHSLLIGWREIMNFYLISYDLIQDKNYKGLIDAIKSIANGYCTPLKSVWLIGNSGTSSEVRNYLSGYIDSDDKLLVVKLSDEAAWTTSIGNDNAQWILNHLQP